MCYAFIIFYLDVISVDVHDEGLDKNENGTYNLQVYAYARVCLYCVCVCMCACVTYVHVLFVILHVGVIKITYFLLE